MSGAWERLKPRLARWLPPLGYLTAQPIPGSCCHLQRGMIQPPYACEINAVDHCNMACRDCDHASPAMPPSCLPPETALSDLSRLARSYRARHVKIVGGEPLLHPDLPELLRAVRKSGISRSLHLLSNGRLIERLPEGAWRQLDILEISLYPDTPLSGEQLELIRDRAREHGVKLQFWQHDRVHVTFALRGTEDDSLVEQIHRTCHKPRDGCHAVHHGYLYACSQSLYISRLLEASGKDFERDRLAIDDRPGLRERLIDFLSRPTPLTACRYCMGSVGRIRAHDQVDRADWMHLQDRTVEQQLDAGRLVAGESLRDARERLKTRVEP